jgi:hypothetical protein
LGRVKNPVIIQALKILSEPSAIWVWVKQVGPYFFRKKKKSESNIQKNQTNVEKSGDIKYWWDYLLRCFSRLYFGEVSPSTEACTKRE